MTTIFVKQYLEIFSTTDFLPQTIPYIIIVWDILLCWIEQTTKGSRKNKTQNEMCFTIIQWQAMRMRLTYPIVFWNNKCFTYFDCSMAVVWCYIILCAWLVLCHGFGCSKKEEVCVWRGAWWWEFLFWWSVISVVCGWFLMQIGIFWIGCSNTWYWLSCWITWNLECVIFSKSN